MAPRVYSHVVQPSSSQTMRLRDALSSAAYPSIKVDTDATDVRRLTNILLGAIEVAPQAVALALNRTASTARTDMSRALSKQMGLPKGKIHRALKILRASRGYLVAKIEVREPHLPLGVFRSRQTKRGVSAAPWNKRRVFPHTFFIPKYGNNVYVRQTSKRFPLHKLFGPAIPVEFVKDASAATFEKVVPRELLKRLDHELGRLLPS